MHARTTLTRSHVTRGPPGSDTYAPRRPATREKRVEGHVSRSYPSRSLEPPKSNGQKKLPKLTFTRAGRKRKKTHRKSSYSDRTTRRGGGGAAAFPFAFAFVLAAGFAFAEADDATAASSEIAPSVGFHAGPDGLLRRFSAGGATAAGSSSAA